MSAQARGGAGVGGKLTERTERRFERIEREAESTRVLVSTRVRIHMQAHNAKQHRQRCIEQRSTLGLQDGARALLLLAPPLTFRGRTLLEATTGRAQAQRVGEQERAVQERLGWRRGRRHVREQGGQCATARELHEAGIIIRERRKEGKHAADGEPNPTFQIREPNPTFQIREPNPT